VPGKVEPGKIIAFKARPNKSRDHYYIYIPKQWSPDIQKTYEKRGYLYVVIKIPD